MLTPKRLGSYPPDTWMSASATSSGLMLGSIVSFKAERGASNPGKIKVLISFKP